jgi:hypothetical protein
MADMKVYESDGAVIVETRTRVGCQNVASGHDVCCIAEYVENPTDNLRGVGELYRPGRPHEERLG